MCRVTIVTVILKKVWTLNHLGIFFENKTFNLSNTWHMQYVSKIKHNHQYARELKRDRRHAEWPRVLKPQFSLIRSSHKIANWLLQYSKITYSESCWWTRYFKIAIQFIRLIFKSGIFYYSKKNLFQIVHTFYLCNVIRSTSQYKIYKKLCHSQTM